MDRPLSHDQAPADLPAAETSNLTIFEVAPGADRPAGPLCCVGVDEPGVGWVHSADCVNAGGPIARGPIARGRDYAAGEVPERLRDFMDEIGSPLEERKDERDAYLSQLLFAARDLARANVMRGCGPEDEGTPLSCRECHFAATSDGRLQHARSCNTGRVFAALAGLLAMLDDQPAEPDRDFTVLPVEATRGLAERVCLKCGARGGEWRSQLRPECEVELSLLGLNQCVGAGLGWRGAHTLYTHQCEKDSGQRSVVSGGAR